MLAGLDHLAIVLAQGHAIHALWVYMLCMFLLPLLWAFVCAIARGADDPAQTWSALGAFLHRRVWDGALFAGARVPALTYLIWTVFGHMGRPTLRHCGELLEAVAAQTYLVTIAAGLCYFPLLLFAQGLTAREARRLSLKAEALNSRRLLSRFVLLVLGAGAMVRSAGAVAWSDNGGISGIHGHSVLRGLSGHLRAPERKPAAGNAQRCRRIDPTARGSKRW